MPAEHPSPSAAQGSPGSCDATQTWHNRLHGFHLRSALSETEHASTVQPVLVIHGELDAMTRDWSASELADSYRLVAFDAATNGPTATVTFRASYLVEYEQRPSAPFLACLRDDQALSERDQFFFAVPDFVSLFIALLGIRVDRNGRIKIAEVMAKIKSNPVSLMFCCPMGSCIQKAKLISQSVRGIGTVQTRGRDCSRSFIAFLKPDLLGLVTALPGCPCGPIFLKGFRKRCAR